MSCCVVSNVQSTFVYVELSTHAIFLKERYTSKRYNKRSKKVVSRGVREGKDYKYLDDILRLYFYNQRVKSVNQFRAQNRFEYDTSPPRLAFGADKDV